MGGHAVNALIRNEQNILGKRRIFIGAMSFGNHFMGLG